MKRLLLLLSMTLLAGNASAENEGFYNFNTGILNVPKVNVANTYYEVDLKLTNISQDGVIDFSLIDLKEAQEENSIVGSWGNGFYPNAIDSQGEQEYISLTFYPNGTYIHFETGQLTEQCDNGGGGEYGTYVYNQVSRKLQVSPVSDGNGCVGLADNKEPYQLLATVSGDTLVVCEGTTSCLEQGTAFSRVK